MNIQADLAQRCIELLSFENDEPKFVLDIGCGSGISGQELSDCGHDWVGLDISRDMLSTPSSPDVARDRDSDGELLECDIGQGFNFRGGIFDGAISVSVIQRVVLFCLSRPSSSTPRTKSSSR